MFQHWFKFADIDGVFWSLAVELSFYLFIAAILLIKKIRYIEIISLAWLGIMYINFLALSPLNNYFPFIKFGNLFIAGIIFYNLKTKGRTKIRYVILALCLLIQFLITTPLEGFVVAFYFLIFFLLIDNRLKFLTNKFLVFLGFISYSIYLIHENTGAIIFTALSRIGINSLVLKIGITTTIIIIIATLITYLLEQPLMRILKNGYRKTRKKYVKES